MGHVAPVYPNFSRGEVSPLMFGRIDLEQYPSCLDKCRNMYIRPYGCASRLSGTEFIANTKNNSKARLLKFVFSATDSYIIECGAGYFRFYQDGAPVYKNGVVYEISNDYYADQLETIQYVQLDDIIKLTCKPHAGDNSTAKPKELIRHSSDNWEFKNVDFKETPYLDQNTTDITMTASAATGSSITITASENYFTSSMVGANMWIGTKVTDSDTNKDVQGYVKITAYTDEKHVTAEVKSKLSTTSATKLWGEGAFSNRRGYPAVVALFDGRLYYARTPYQPRNIYGSKPYEYETFTPAVDNEDDAGINIELATNANGDGSDIKWMIGASYLLCGTYGGEFVIRSSGDEAVTPTNISARQRTNWGGEPVQPIVAGTFVHFLQRNGNKLRQFQYDYYYDAYKAVDVSIFSEHLLESPIKAMALQKNPDSVIYLMREDGKVVMLTLEQDQAVQAWSLLEEMGASVESIQTIPSYNGNYDEVYLVMNRRILSTSLSITCSNPDLTVTNNYHGTKTEGVEVINLTYDATNGVWVDPSSTKLNTKLIVTSSNQSLNPTTTYSGSKSEEGTITEVLTYSKDGADVIATKSLDYNNSYWYSIAYGKNIYVAMGSNSPWSYYATSSDGVNFNYTYSLAFNKGAFLALAYGNNMFVALSDSGYIAATDGTSSKYLSSSTFPYTNFVGLAHGDGKFVGLTGYGRIYYSSASSLSSITNVNNWAEGNNINIEDRSNWRGIAFGNGKFIAISADGYISTSANGINWTAPVQNATLSGFYYGNTWRGITYGDGRFAAITYYGHISYSADGNNWTTPILLNVVDDKIKWEDLVYGQNKYTAVNSDGYIAALYNGSWKNPDNQNVDLSSSNYKISLANTPQNGDTLTCEWNTIEGYADISILGISVEGTPSNNDTITLTYTTTLSSSARYIERMCDPITPENRNDWWYVRSGLKYSGYERTSGVTLNLSAGVGNVTATASSAIFDEDMVGNRIRYIDSEYNVLGEGTITEFTSSTVVQMDVTTFFQSVYISSGRWGISTDVLSGLDHLNGREIEIYADGIEQERKTVIEGSVNIDDAFLAVAGLPYTSYLTTMPMEAGSQNGTAVGKRKRISEMAIRVWNTIGARVGRDLDNLYDTIYKQKEPFTGVIPNIKYNQGWKWDANITVEQSHAYPMNILSIAPIVTEVDK